MSDADIIATLYFDSMDIYRKEKVKDPNTGVTTMQEVLKYSNLQCALDKGSEVTTAGETGTAYISAAYKLFCRPTVDIKVGDKLVITYNGITGEFEAGEKVDSSTTVTPENQGAIKSISRGSVRIEYNYDSVSSESMSNSSTKTSPELTSEEMKVLNKYRRLRF